VIKINQSDYSVKTKCRNGIIDYATTIPILSTMSHAVDVACLTLGKLGDLCGQGLVSIGTCMCSNCSDANQPVARHFNMPYHCVSGMKILTLCSISLSNDSRKRRLRKVGTVHTYGINERFPYMFSSLPVKSSIDGTLNAYFILYLFLKILVFL
jgi:hypothetical protein